MSFENLKEVKRNFLLTFSRQLLGFILNIFSSVLLARLLLEDGYGIYSLIIVYANLIMQFVSLGVNAGNVYFLAKNVSKDSIFVNSLVFTVMVSAVIIPLSYYLLQYFTDLDGLKLWLCLISVPILLLNLNINSIFQGIQDFKKYNMSMFFNTVVLVLYQLVVVYFDGELIHYLLAFVLSNFTSFLASMILVKRHVSFNLKNFNAGILRGQISFGIKNYLSNILTFINYRGDMIIMDKYLAPNAVGIYNVGVIIAEKLWMISTTLSTALYPKLSEISDKIEESRLLVITLSKATLIINLLACGFVYLIGEWAILEFYGAGYQESVYALYVLLPGICCTSVARILSNYISSINRPLYNFYVSLFTVFLNITLNIILIPKYFILGAAFTTSLVYFINLIIKCILFYRLSGTNYKEILWNKIDSAIFLKMKWRKK